jgi:hypothetical protein
LEGGLEKAVPCTIDLEPGVGSLYPTSTAYSNDGRI